MRQKPKMYCNPYKPCGKTVDTKVTAFEHCEPFTNDGEVYLVEITERNR